MALSSSALGRRPNLLRHYFSVAQLSYRIGSSETRGFRSSSLLEVAPCKEEFEIGSYRVSFETSTPPEQGSGDGIILTMRKKKDQSLSKVFSTVSASPLLPDVDYQGNQYPCNDRVGSSFVRRDSARIIRTPIRPLFPAHFYHDVEVMARVLCCNGEQDTDVMAANAASAALMLSDIPWGGPIGVVRIGRIRGEFLVNPSRDEVLEFDHLSKLSLTLVDELS
ncbi:hypothetical protein MKW94_019221 [Papaver nudicaule]|uniref:Exoribonuclease phosphorolytic domain-containing protein n=1 Tax=Papaver nudicaule TaxID=74823 RepID=A0AA41W315_PAPNU|nr:hypothetical protein [Papaver nudicaule]